ncbi:hypothetical protein [Deinococcus multiflagellatus]|uniref:Uncharacterized protein n=1 Tax=Deinococcus multiflagellatus TaxID=1656887 RepID=A0ABW1ZRT2_9DEIO|nr:hypothetical protein [Deinococcus multiflagellatus]MBZ9714411.1 hypothetical protein [Deinococcus multiflagellatus]
MTLTELLVTVTMVGLLTGSVLLMMNSQNDSTALTFDLQLKNLMQTMPSAARAQGAAITLSADQQTARLSTGRTLTIPTGLALTSNLQATPGGVSGAVIRQAGTNCTRFTLTLYGTVTETAC